VSAGLRSGQLAAAAGVTVETLRFYERRGLLQEPGRTLGGHRLYPAESLTVLRAIRGAQRLGFTLAEIAELLGTGSRRRSVGLADRAAARLAEVEAALQDLARTRTALRAALDAGCHDLAGCAEAECCPLL
jgi:DNA-binding transcriptional MerR regulator